MFHLMNNILRILRNTALFNLVLIPPLNYNSFYLWQIKTFLILLTYKMKHPDKNYYCQGYMHAPADISTVYLWINLLPIFYPSQFPLNKYEVETIHIISLLVLISTELHCSSILLNSEHLHSRISCCKCLFT